ncbi:MAG TPA: hypothetical protein VGB89_12625 [Bacteroidota bacterium]|jgi:hypothetical protein
MLKGIPFLIKSLKPAAAMRPKPNRSSPIFKNWPDKIITEANTIARIVLEMYELAGCRIEPGLRQISETDVIKEDGIKCNQTIELRTSWDTWSADNTD